MPVPKMTLIRGSLETYEKWGQAGHARGSQIQSSKLWTVRVARAALSTGGVQLVPS